MKKRRGPGRPRNRYPSVTVSVQIQRPIKRAFQQLAEHDGVALATWLRQIAMRELARRSAELS